MKKILSIIWEAPQKALAHIIKWITKAEELTDSSEESHLYLWNLKGGLSLSNHIFLPISSFGNKGPQEIMDSRWHLNYVRHEGGHSIQSKYLGPFYLLIIGLPSIIWAGCFKGYRKKHNISYYSFYTESSADKLGGVKREG